MVYSVFYEVVDCRVVLCCEVLYADRFYAVRLFAEWFHLSSERFNVM